MNASEAKIHIENVRNEIGDLLFHQASLEREIQLLQPEVESRIVKPSMITDISKLTEKDMQVDLAPVKTAGMDLVQKRKAFYYARQELAGVLTTIEAKKNLLNTYIKHMKQELLKQSKPVTDDMIFEKLGKIRELTNLSPEEQKVIDDIMGKAPSLMASNKEARIELYETLQNLILQHGA